MTVTHDRRRRRATGDVLLVALGRTPQTRAARARDARARGRRATSRSTRTCSVPGHDWLYAIGDVNGRALFTHMGKYQARIAADHILGHDRALAHGADGPLSPARDLHRPAGRGGRPHDRDGASEAGLDRRRRRDVDLGQRRRLVLRPQRARHDALARRPRARGSSSARTITGAEVADFLHAATIAIVGEVPLERLRHAVPAFPTRSEIWLQLLEKPASRRRPGPSSRRATELVRAAPRSGDEAPAAGMRSSHSTAAPAAISAPASRRAASRADVQARLRLARRRESPCADVQLLLAGREPDAADRAGGNRGLEHSGSPSMGAPRRSAASRTHPGVPARCRGRDPSTPMRVI